MPRIDVIVVFGHNFVLSKHSRGNQYLMNLGHVT